VVPLATNSASHPVALHLKLSQQQSQQQRSNSKVQKSIANRMSLTLLTRKTLPQLFGSVRQVSLHISSRNFSTTLEIPAESLQLSEKNRRLVVNWKNSPSDQFPFVWLRDNCQCSQCFDSSSQSRTINLSLFKTDIQPRHADIKNSEVEIIWNDGHKSVYNSHWLQQRSFRREAQLKWLHSDRLPSDMGRRIYVDFYASIAF